MEANNKAMRDALIRISELTTPCEGITSIELQVNDIARSALAEPVRNCEVGTADEQFERWKTLCDKYDEDCTGCPLDKCRTCTLAYCFARWVQMPYEEGETK